MGTPHPETLEDLERGRSVRGNKFPDASAMPRPEWLDSERLARGQAFFHAHFLSALFSYFCALVVGFSVAPLAKALLFTGRTAGAERSLKRYLETLVHLCRWSCGDPFEPASAAHASLLAVRGMHDRVRRGMTEARPEEAAEQSFVSQLDTAEVQSAFVGPLLLFGPSFGLAAAEAGLGDYVHFWRCLGHCLGLEDAYNVCGGGLRPAGALSEEILQRVVRPGLEGGSEDADRLSEDFIKGAQAISPWLTLPLVHAFVLPQMGLPAPALDWRETGTLAALRAFFWLLPRWAWLRRRLNARVWADVRQRHPELSDVDFEQF